MQAWKILVIVGLVAAAPTVGAAHPDCQASQDQTVALADLYLVLLPSGHAGTTDTGLYAETNDIDGLQIRDVTCAGIKTDDADRQIASLP